MDNRKKARYGNHEIVKVIANPEERIGHFHSLTEAPKEISEGVISQVANFHEDPSAPLKERYIAFFKPLNDDKSCICTVCQQRCTHVPFSNFISHLFTSHRELLDPIDFVKAKKARDSIRFGNAGPASDEKDTTNPKNDRITTLDYFLDKPGQDSRRHRMTLAIAVATGCFPFAMVDNPGFRFLAQKWVPGIKLPSRTSIRTEIMKLYETYKTHVGRLIEEEATEGVCTTMDAWTDIEIRPFIGVTISFVDTSFKLRTFNLATRFFDVPHTSKNIAEKHEEVFTGFGVSPAIAFATVTDNGANFAGAVEYLHDNITNFYCAAHTLQLVLGKAFAKGAGSYEFHNIVACAQRIARTIRISPAKRKLLRERNIKIPVLDVETRWNSKYMLLERMYDIFGSIGNIPAKEMLGKSSASDIEDWQTAFSTLANHELAVKFLLVALKRVTMWTELLSSRQEVTISLVPGAILDLAHTFKSIESQAPSTNNGALVKVWMQSLLESLEAQFPETTYLFCNIFKVIMALDFRTFHLVVNSADDLRGIYHIIRTMNLIPPQKKVSTAQSKSERRFMVPVENDTYSGPHQFGKHLAAIAKIDEEYPLEDDAIQNKKLSFERMKIDPLKIWAALEPQLPDMARLARKLLCIPATSTDCERLFSLTGRLVTKTRNRLHGETTEALALLQEWLRLDFLPVPLPTEMPPRDGIEYDPSSASLLLENVPAPERDDYRDDDDDRTVVSIVD
jgi:hypothetical protein